MMIASALQSDHTGFDVFLSSAWLEVIIETLHTSIILASASVVSDQVRHWFRLTKLCNSY